MSHAKVALLLTLKPIIVHLKLQKCSNVQESRSITLQMPWYLFMTKNHAIEIGSQINIYKIDDMYSSTT